LNRVQRILALGSALELGDPNVAGKSLAEIVLFLLRRIAPHQRPNAIRKMIIKFQTLSSEEISGKDMKPFSSMGQSISFIKNVLAGHDALYVRKVLDAIVRNLVY
jgi:hypothetical protein